ncbi:hypothetical protein DDB_G0270310 [Dictyostelium discoideum AX4]|uniref:Transmembrane protein n=1 Tax=Dictyostelium discoideum TaxID=44689 RepID=Q55BY7_DICDI|nr:hypothetical protein DDB_G0270310 [Dictyostelium discoideum AX4]EAL72505.1 hypothetical protein DDB_G0270310 [Dictyostelium discoideum AX4]|eukprot:XP_646694.1 hypothetical protein DDB_G0270310 [Dictyostelium discoideum AX4]
MQKPKVLKFIYSFILRLSLIVLGLSFSQITNKYKGQSYGTIEITKSYVDTICLYSEAVPYTQTFLFYATEWQRINTTDSSSSNTTTPNNNSTDSQTTPTTNDGWGNVVVGVEEGFVECAWRNRNSVLRVIVHILSILSCVIALTLIKKQKLNPFLVNAYLMTIIGMAGIYSGVVDSIGVKRAYDFCMTLSPFYSSDCYYKAFNCTVVLNFLCSAFLFICAVLSSRFRYILFNESGDVNNNNTNNNSSNSNSNSNSNRNPSNTRNREVDIENNASSPNNIELKPPKPSKPSKPSKNNRDHSILEEEVDFENNGTILTTNDQYITSNNDRDL